MMTPWIIIALIIVALLACGGCEADDGDEVGGQ